MKGGHILYDAAERDHIHEHVFTPSYWRIRDALSEPLGGRGAAFRIHADDVDWVLRFYRRGGLPGRVILDRYFYTGLERTRAWREWRLLEAMHEMDLPVPRPVAARVIRNGFSYQAAIITRTVPGASLASLATADDMSEAAWRMVGRTIRKLHDAGVWHADLNAHNILVDRAHGDQPDVHVIDFDRGRLRPQDTAWRRANLSRLERSLRKVIDVSQQERLLDEGVRLLHVGYQGYED